MENLEFWAIAGAMTLGVAALLLLSLWRTRKIPAPAALRDIQVYRDQLSEVDRDLARGTLAEAEAQRLKTEIARRLLAADKALSTDRPVVSAAGGTALLLPAVLVLAAGAGALALYSRTGVPWYPDMPLARRLAETDAAMANRRSQADAVATITPVAPPEVSPDYAALIDKLRATVDPKTATDPRGLELLARNEAALGNFATAEAAQRRLIAVKAEAATAEDFAGLAEILIRWANGYISPEAEQELLQALERDPKNGLALYLSGLMFAQNGRYDRAFALWRPLYEDSPQDAPWMEMLAGQLAEIAPLAGEAYRPPAMKGPSQADMAAAADMSDADRQAMIEGMVQQLNDRLAAEGGPVEDWARLITALGVLSRKDEAQAIYDEARTRFAGRDADLAVLAEAAGSAGLAP